MRPATLRILVRTARTGSLVSPAAMVTSSVPKYEKNTVSADTRIAVQPIGNRPPCPRRFVVPGARWLPNSPAIAAMPIAMNTTIAPTLISANQNSNRANELTAARFTAVSALMKIKA